MMLPRPDPLSRHWLLDPSVVYLNHGSFGACPRAVLEHQQSLRELLEREPVQFFDRQLPVLLDRSRTELAAFLRADPAGLVFVPNATHAVNAVLRSLRLGPGDELLLTDHEYNACRQAAEYVTRFSGARLVVAELPFPLSSPEQAIAPVLKSITPRTRLVLIDHVTSPTALVLPIETLVEQIQSRGVDALVDGAHAPGMLPLDLDALNAAYYTGNCHKWLCTPKGSAFLHVRRDRRELIHPLSISHGYCAPADERRFRLEFDWTGTGDPTAWLSIPAALQFMDELLPGGWPALMQRNRELALQARDLLAAALNVEPPCPDQMIGSMAALPLPQLAEPVPPSLPDPLQIELLQRYNIELPVPRTDRLRLLRISAQAYNSLEQYQYLAEALGELFE